MKQLFLAAAVLATFPAWAGAADQAPAPGDERAAHAADIAYWTKNYQGQDLFSGKFDCPAPAIPAVSTTNVEIKAVSASVAAWEACYNGFVDNLHDAMPAGKRIPAEIARLMTPAEMEAARAHLEHVYDAVGINAQANAADTISKRDAWRSATEKYVAEQNEAQKKMEEQMREQEKQRRDMERSRQAQPVIPPMPRH